MLVLRLVSKSLVTTSFIYMRNIFKTIPQRKISSFWRHPRWLLIPWKLSAGLNFVAHRIPGDGISSCEKRNRAGKDFMIRKSLKMSFDVTAGIWRNFPEDVKFLSSHAIFILNFTIVIGPLRSPSVWLFSELVFFFMDLSYVDVDFRTSMLQG